MSKLLTRVSMFAFGLFVAGGLAFGTTEAFGSSTTSGCSGQPEELGTCPGEYTQVECDADCLNMYGNPGFCIRGCCVCLV